MERRTRIWLGLGTALLVGGTGVERVALARETPDRSIPPPSSRRCARRPTAAHPRRAGRGRRRRRPGRGRRPGPRDHHRVPPLEQRHQRVRLRCGEPRSAAYVDLVADDLRRRAGRGRALCGRRSPPSRRRRRRRRSRPRARRGSRRAPPTSGPRPSCSTPARSMVPAARCRASTLAGRSRRRSTASSPSGAVAQLPRHRAAQQRSSRRSRSPPASTSSSICSGAPTAR